MHRTVSPQSKDLSLVPQPRGIRLIRSKQPSSPSIDLLRAMSTANDASTRTLVDCFSDFAQFDLHGRVEVEELCTVSGGFTDVFRGLLRLPGQPGVSSTVSPKELPVAVKRFRINNYEEFSVGKRIINEFRIWMSLEHCNVLPCLGFMVHKYVPSFVSEWMVNGNVKSYLSTYPSADRHPLISGIACGLKYLHSQDVIHSDLKSANVLVNNEGRPMICDFSNSRLGSMEDASLFGSYPWMARELFLSDESESLPYTKKSDVWSFGMVVYEIISGKVPFHGLKRGQVIMEILSGQVPKRSTVDKSHIEGLDEIWSVCTWCWATNPADRPTMDVVLKRLNAIRVKADVPIESDDKLLHGVQEPECPVKFSPTVPLLNKSFSTEESLDRNSTLFPQDLDVTNRLQIGRIRAQGGSADIYDGMLKRDSHSRDLYPISVAVKKFRLVLNSSSENLDKPRQEQMSSFTRELKVWINLSHANILPCLGFAKYESNPALISERVENGSLPQYLNENTRANKLEMAKGIACGLEYIHSVGVVHGDLKGANVLIRHDGRPMLTDFGNSYVVTGDGSVSGIYPLRFSLRWAAIELLDQPDSEPHRFQTKETDIWAYGMVLYEIISQKLPFYHLEEFSVLAEILVGNLPKRPTVWIISRTVNRLWSVCLRCWAKDPADRPTVTQIVQTLT